MATLKNTTISDTGSLNLPAGTTAQRPASPVAGQIRYNTTINDTEYYDGGAWRPISDSNPEATGGTIVDTDIGGVPYRIHLFTNTGNSTFTVTKGGLVEYLIVAGGGGTGEFCGGGGAGGLLTGITTVTPQSYTITVGAGAPRNPAGLGSSNGNDSIAFGLTAIGGGGGQSSNVSLTGKNGGSGGGNGPRGGNGGLATQPGSSSGGFGNNGGNGRPGETSNDGGSGGGGGAGGPGLSGSFRQGGNGGIGLLSYISGVPTWYAGGGGGFGDARNGPSIRGTGGLGGGGAGAIGTTGGNDAESGPANTGGGAGGGGPSASTGGRDGGSGIVIVRYRRNASTTTSPNETRPSFQPFFYARDVRPIIVRTSLTLEFDPSNTLSYLGSGNIYRSLCSADIATIFNISRAEGNFGGFRFNGSNTHIRVEGNPPVDGVDNLTVSAVINRNAGLGGAVLSKRAGCPDAGVSRGNNRSIELNVNNDGNLSFIYPNGTGGGTLPAGRGGTSVVAEGVVPSEEWVMITATFTAQNVILYVNDLEVRRETPVVSTVLKSDQFLRIGSSWVYCGGDNSPSGVFNGNIATVLTYDRALSLQEIQTNYLNLFRIRRGLA